MNDKETVCAVVVTYNRKDLLIECLDALCKQSRPIDAIYIIDNFSNDGTAELLLENGYIEKLPPDNLNEPLEMEINFDNSEFLSFFDDGIEVRESKLKNQINIYYVRMNENTGGAGGFYEGVKRGYERGYEWLWIMDDDAEPYNDSLEKLESYFLDQNIVALANSVIKPNGDYDLKHRGLADFKEMFPNIQQPIPLEYYQKSTVKIHTASFVGLLIKSSAIKLIGFPIKDFFIHNDDIEYCLRLMQIGELLLIPSSKIKHKEASNTNTKRIEYKKLWLKYYGRRNLIILANKYSQNKSKFYYKIFISTIKSIIGILLLDDHKIKRIKFTISSILDGLNNRLDNDKPKKILYK